MLRIFVMFFIFSSLTLHAELTQAQTTYVQEVHQMASKWREFGDERFEMRLAFLKPLGIGAASLAGLSWAMAQGEDYDTTDRICFWTMATTLGLSVKAFFSTGITVYKAGQAMKKIVEEFNLQEAVITDLKNHDWDEKERFLEDIEKIKQAKAIVKDWSSSNEFFGWGY